MRALLEVCSSAEFEDSGWIVVDRVTSEGDDLEVAVTVGYDDDTPSSVWSIRCSRVAEFQLCANVGDALQLHSDHPLVWCHTEAHCHLAFRRGPDARPVSEAIGTLWSAHRELVGAFVPFERFLNESIDIRRLLARDYGELARGPSRLLSTYRDALMSAGYVADCWREFRPVQWREGRYVPIDEPL